VNPLAPLLPVPVDEDFSPSLLGPSTVFALSSSYDHRRLPSQQRGHDLAPRERRVERWPVHRVKPILSWKSPRLV